MFVLVCFGCGNKVKLTGSVRFSDDGKPLTVGMVCFENEQTGSLARGELSADGRFVLGSVSEKDGLPPGNYRVYIAGAMLDEGETGSPIPLIDRRYGSGKTSDLRYEIDASTKNLEITVDRYSAK